MTASVLDNHVKWLCRYYDIERTVAPGRGRARVRAREIQHPPIREPMNYFVALHEIGHVVLGLGGTRLGREAAAWDWALAHAWIEPHYSIRQRICALLWRYLYRAQERGWAMPPAESRYWALMRWWA